MDNTGDHITLLNLFNAFDTTRNKADWCHKFKLDYESLKEIERTRQYILESLLKLQIALPDDEAKIKNNGGFPQALLRALCSGYFDHIAVMRRPGSPGDGFEWFLGKQQRASYLDAAKQFSQQHMPPPVPSNNNNSSTNADPNTGKNFKH